jgi:hypothetical protein
MSTSAPKPASRSRWMDWKPGARFLADSTGTEPTKLSKPGFVAFEGVTSTKFPEIEPRSCPVELPLASAALNRAGVRIMRLDGKFTIGVWSDLDGAKIRAALRTLGMDRLPVRYLDGAGIPLRYKLRRVEGEPIPMSVLAQMERHSGESWEVRAPAAESPH